MKPLIQSHLRAVLIVLAVGSSLAAAPAENLGTISGCVSNRAVALNEQRFSPNIRHVMAADSFGDVLGSSGGEFLKFLPGIALEEDGNEVQGVSILEAGPRYRPAPSRAGQQ